jgi:hypothetical protein
MNAKLLPSTAMALACLLLAAGCTGGGSGSGNNPAATGLVYTNPVNVSDEFALLQDPASTPTTLVLDLVGPSTTDASKQIAGLGVTFSLQVDTTRANWNQTPVVKNGTVFTQSSGPYGATTPIVQGWVLEGNLQGIVSNKGLGNTVANMGLATICQIQLNVVPGAQGAVSLADSGYSTYMDPDGGQWPIRVKVGTLTIM